MPRLCVILFCCALLTAPIRAADWSEFARSAPPDAHMLLVVEQAAKLRTGPAGAALTNLFNTILPLTTTTEAWDALARELDVPPTAAFDMLLGNRIAVLTRVRPDGVLDWAFTSEVDGKVAYRLLDRLGAKTKHIEFNQPVATIENGKFQLTYGRRGQCATLLFAPTTSEALFIDLVKRMRRAEGESLLESPGFVDAAKGAFPDAHAFVFARIAGEDGHWLSASARVGEADVELNLIASYKQRHLPETPLTRAQWQRFAEGSLLAVIEPLALEDLPLGWLLSRFGMGEIDDWLLPIKGRGAVAITEDRPGELAIVGALETSSVRQMAPLGDALIAQFASRIAVSNRTERVAEDFNTLAGAFPTATRRVTISAPDAEGRPQPNPLGGEPLELVWSFQPLPARSDDHGWWIVSNSAAAHDRAAASLIKDESRAIDAAVPVSFFKALPARLGESLRRAKILEEPSSLSRLLALIELVEGRTEADGAFLRGWSRVSLRR